MRPWLASACWQLLIALQLQKDAVVIYKSLAERATLDLRVFTRVASTIGCRTLEDLGNTSEVQADERIIPDITDLDVPLVMGSRLREPIRQPRKQRRSSGTKSVKERWKTRMFHEQLRS